ncbi:MAG: protein kinase [bacterium]|nr:protein kinase [bacterium]
MESVLQKTVQSLEAALRYNPTSVELMTSLAEVYVRLGRFDRRTMELCDAVLARQDHPLLQQAQSIGDLLEQAQKIEECLERGEAPPEPDVLRTSLNILEEFMTQVSECADLWLAWTRFQILILQIGQALKGIEALGRLGVKDLGEELMQSIQWASRSAGLTSEQGRHLAELYLKLGNQTRAIRQLEKLYDDGVTTIGEGLLSLYLERYSVEHADEVPDSVRSRLFILLLDHADRQIIGAWLRKATIYGWEVSTFIKGYARHLIGDGELGEAFALLQRLGMDAEVKDLLNEIAAGFERSEEIDRAVSVLRYINDNELIETEVHRRRERELVREAELSMALLQAKNGRYNEALQKYVSAMKLSPRPDLALLDAIDELIEGGHVAESDALIQLGLYFREQKDNPKAVFYLNHALEIDPENKNALHELEALFDDILHQNPDLPDLRLELGQLYLRMNRNEQAIEELKLAATSPASSARAGRLLAQALARTGQFVEALDKYRSLPIEETDCEALYDLHQSLMQKDAPREALAALDMICRVKPDYRDVSEKIAAIEKRTGRQQSDITVDPKMRELIGDLAIGRYQYIEQLGSGGMGVVYKVRDLRSQQTVAMKILRDGLSGSSKALDRFFREARIAATLHHRNIVNIHDYNISNISGQSYIAMEYVDGPSLREIIDRQFENSIKINLDYITEILYYAAQLCDALEAAHHKGIVHRDIKPDNVMINSRGEVKITDFGIVHVEQATFTPTGAMLGTPRYMSPEQVTGEKIDGRSDIYSVGILLYEVLVGSPPFMTGDISYQQVHNPPVPPREINPVIPQVTNEMILKCLAKKPEDRYPNAMALKQILGQQLDDLGGCAKYNHYQTTDVIEPVGLDHELDLD